MGTEDVYERLEETEQVKGQEGSTVSQVGKEHLYFRTPLRIWLKCLKYFATIPVHLDWKTGRPEQAYLRSI